MSNKKNNFILQAGFLAAAGFISRIIGMLYVFPVSAIIGTVGLGYYSSAYNYYTIILLISSYSIPSAISKVIAQKLSLREYRNAHRMFICSLCYVLGVGVLASLLLFFGAGLFVEESAIPVLRVFAPTVFLYGILGVLRGYFQAHKSMIQTSVSQILEQIANCAVSIGAAYGLIMMSVGTLEVSADPVVENTRAVYGAMGSAIGTGAGVVVALLFMLGIYGLNHKLIHTRIKRDKTKRVDSYADITRTIVSVVMPFILSTAAYNVSSALNNKLYTVISIYHNGMEEASAYANYGIFNGEAMKISNIPIAFASAMAAAIIPTISQLVAVNDKEEAKRKIHQAVKTVMLLSIPSAFGLFALAKPMIGLLFPREQNVALAVGALMTLAPTVVFYALSTLTNSILQGTGEVNTPIKHALIALFVQTAVLVPILLFTKLDIYGLVIASGVYSLVVCILNQRAVRKALGYRQEIIRTFAIPAFCAMLMGMISFGIYYGVYLLIPSNVIAVIPAVIVAVIVYFVLLVVLGGVTESELKAMPKGYLLVKLMKKIRLLK